MMPAGRRRGGLHAHTYAQACAHAYTLGSGSSAGCVKPGYPGLPCEKNRGKDSYCSRPLVNALQLQLSPTASRHHSAYALNNQLHTCGLCYSTCWKALVYLEAIQNSHSMLFFPYGF